jgi:hypothetical protein
VRDEGSREYSLVPYRYSLVVTSWFGIKIDLPDLERFPDAKVILPTPEADCKLPEE